MKPRLRTSAVVRSLLTLGTLTLAGWIGLLWAVSPEIRTPERQPDNRWRIAWSAETGRQYRLERTTELRGTGQVWEPVAILTATNPIVSADDLVSPGTEVRFYRVVELPGGTGTAPLVSPLRTTPSALTAEGWVTVEVDASDDTSVAGVRILDGATFLGDALRHEDDTWRFLWQVGLESNGTRQLRAEARDTDGNRTLSDSAPFTVAIAQSQHDWYSAKASCGRIDWRRMAASCAPSATSP